MTAVLFINLTLYGAWRALWVKLDSGKIEKGTFAASKVFWSQKTAGGDSDEPRLLLDGDFPIPRLTQISSVAARCAIAFFLPLTLCDLLFPFLQSQQI